MLINLFINNMIIFKVIFRLKNKLRVRLKPCLIFLFNNALISLLILIMRAYSDTVTNAGYHHTLIDKKLSRALFLYY